MRLYSTYIAYSFSVDEDVPRHEGPDAVEDEGQVEEVVPVGGGLEGGGQLQVLGMAPAEVRRLTPCKY